LGFDKSEKLPYITSKGNIGLKLTRLFMHCMQHINYLLKMILPFIFLLILSLKLLANFDSVTYKLM
jgi:hypothetical protein